MAKFEVVKIPVALNGKPTVKIKIPIGGTILTFRSRLGEPVIYVKSDPKAKLETRTFKILSTAVPMTDELNLHYIGTVEWALEGWHLFELLASA